MNEPVWKPPLSGIPVEHLPLWNAAMSHMGHPLPLEGKGTSLRLSPIEAPDLQGPSHEIKLRTGESVYLHLDAFPFNSLLGVDIDLASVRDLEGTLFEAIYEGAGGALLSGLPDDLAASAEFQDLISVDAMVAKSAELDLTWFAAALDGLSQEAIFFSVGVKAAELCGLLRHQNVNSRPVLSGLKNHITTSAYRLVGHRDLPLSDIKGLEAGDLIVLERSTSGGLQVLAEDTLYQFEQAEEGWLCQSVLPMHTFRKSRPMTEDENTPVEATDNDQENAPEMAQTVGTMLTFDLGETPVTLADLESFQAGALVLLPEAVTKNGLEVTVRAAGKPIATGDLVEVDDRIAVRLNRLLVQTT